MEAAVVEPCDRLQAARYGLPFLLGLDEVIRVLVNDAIHIEYYQLHCNLETSALARNSFLSSLNRARRLFLSDSSSHMTITSSKKAST